MPNVSYQNKHVVWSQTLLNTSWMKIGTTAELHSLLMYPIQNTGTEVAEITRQKMTIATLIIII